MNKIVSLARRIYYLATDAGIVTGNPFAKRGLYKEHPKGKYIPHAEFACIMASLPDYLRPVAETAYYTGMRSGEVINLTWDRVDPISGTFVLTPKDTKTNEPRLVYFDAIPELKSILTALGSKRRGRDALVFMDPKGQPLRNWSVGYYFKAASIRAGVGPYRFHDLRHTFNSNMLRAGVEQPIIMKLTGHKSVSMFLRYSHVEHSQFTDAMSKMRAHLPFNGEQAPANPNTITANVLPGQKNKGSAEANRL